MVQVDVSVIVRQRKAFPKELSRGWPPYSSGFNTKRDKVNATRNKVAPPPKSCVPRILLLLLPPLSPSVGRRACTAISSGELYCSRYHLFSACTSRRLKTVWIVDES